MKDKIDIEDLQPEWLLKRNGILQEMLQKFNANILQQEEAIIMQHLPLYGDDVFDISQMTCTIRHNVKTFFYAGEAFIEIWPPEYETVKDGSSTKIICTKKFRDLRGK